MKWILIGSVLWSQCCLAQLIVRPLVVHNAFRIYYNKGTYSYGGKFGATAVIPSLDIEYRFGKSLDSLSSETKLAFNPNYGIIVNVSLWNYENTEKGRNLNSEPMSSSFK